MNKEIHISAYNALLESLEDIETVKQKLQFQINNFDWIGTESNKETITKRIEALELDKIIRYSFESFIHDLEFDASFSHVDKDLLVKRAKDLAKIYIEQAAHSVYALKNS
jgi:hypothetical protein